MNRNLVKKVLLEGGAITPLVISSVDTGGLGLMNPSILVYKDKILVNLRSINYTLYHCEGDQRFNNRWGPLQYLNPENDVKLKTNNFVCTLDDNFNIIEYAKVDTTMLDIPPVWEFHGLEDARLVDWDDKLYLSGVRRDVKPNGEGRMELSEIAIADGFVKEISRFRIPDPKDDVNAYCNKNWMPILDMPYHYVKWVNPTEVVQVDPESKTCKTVFLEENRLQYAFDFRGGSQVLTWGDYRIALVHETCLFKNKLEQKDATYAHRFIVWDKNWNIVHVSELFSFLTAMIEFSCGMAFHKGNLLITFGFQDNAAYLLEIPEKSIEETIGFKNTLNRNKFKDLPPIFVISYETCKNRRKALERQFHGFGIKNYKINITTKDDDDSNLVSGKYVHQLSKCTVNNTVSHIKAIKDWYYNYNTEHALFFEDDISLETSEYWNFTWDDFMNCLPNKWDCIQLVCLEHKLNEVKLIKRDKDFWSVTGYLLNRNYAKHLIDEYGNFHFEIKNSFSIPDGEALIYMSGLTYSIPLFIENTKLESVIRTKEIDNDGIEMHLHSSRFVLNWWKKNGEKADIRELMKL